MADPLTPEQETRFALATLIGAVVHSLDKTNPGTASTFCEIIERRYKDVRDAPSIPPSYLETIRMARDAVKLFKTVTDHRNPLPTTSSECMSPRGFLMSRDSAVCDG